MNTMPETPKSVEFWFDVVCPWCWMTSRWAAEVARARGFDIQWHPFSLKILNEGNDMGAMSESHRQGFRAARVIESARVQHGPRAVGTLYTAIGTRLHPEERKDYDRVIAESIAEAGLPAELAAAADAAEPVAVEEAIRANTAQAIELAGPDVGIPIISIDGVAFFGPVVTPAPTGVDALKLWDGVYAAASVPGFYELKRGRTVGPQF